MHWLSPNTVSSKFSLLNDKPKFSALEGNCLIYIFSEGCEASIEKNIKFTVWLHPYCTIWVGGHSSDLINV